jgi:signal transduction histidine kinase
MFFFPSRRISAWLPLSLVAFALLGSLVLVWVFQRFAEREDRAAFAALAQANAAFLEHSTLPKSEKMAAQLAQLLGVSVWFQQADRRLGQAPPGLPLSLPADAQTRAVRPLLAIGIPLPDRDTSTAIFFARPARPASAVFLRPDTWITLALFWLLAALFGMIVARHVTRPLGQLARAVPLLATEQPLPPLPTNRPDEIGQLARSFQAAHDTVASERSRRTEAERLALLGRMATSLAHEVRNPLAAIRLHAQLLEGASDSERRLSQQLIESETARMEGLVSQWLHFARPTPPLLAAVDLASLQRRTCQLLLPQASHAGVRLIEAAAPDGPPPTVLGDPDRLHQALSNLVLNALQATPTGGEVRLSLRADADHLCLVVLDTGSGFSSTALVSGGDPFFSEREGGMGLGLSVARDIARAHGGSLIWSNRPDPPGAAVTLRFPLAPTV